MTDRLVLTPAFLVADDAPREDETPEAEGEGHAVEDDATDMDDHVGEDSNAFADGQDHESDEDETQQEPLELTNMIWDAPDDTAINDDQQVDPIQTPDRSELVATIAELEAAISSDDAEYEPDGSEVDDGEQMAQTIAWPGTFARSTEGVEEAVTEADDAAEDDSADEETFDADSSVMPFQRSTTDAAPEFDDNAASDVEEFDETEPDSMVAPPEVEADVYADDDIDDLIEAGGVSLDDEALRAMIADVVREELTGPLGERITRNVRKLVRREIYRVLSSQDFD